MIKLIDVRANGMFKGICSNCKRKLKNEYILDNGLILGSECIIKVLGNGLDVTKDLKNYVYEDGEGKEFKTSYKEFVNVLIERGES